MNITGFVVESIVAVRRAPSHAAEMVTQMLFGDLVRLLTEQNGWYHVQALEDGYEGWVSTTMVEPVSEAFLAPDQAFRFVLDAIAPLDVFRHGQYSTINLVKGSRFPLLPFRDKPNELLLKLGQTEYRMREDYLAEPLPATPDALVQTATAYLNAPYLWGGKTPFGVDCSGFTQMLFRQHGVTLPRDSYQQVAVGRSVAWGEQQAGHLAFFNQGGTGVSHVGFLLSPTQIIHGAGRVRIDRLDHNGIWNDELKTYSHRLHSIKAPI